MEYLTEKELAGRLTVTRETLQRWRRRGIGPQWMQIGRTIRYRSADVETWSEDQLTQHMKGQKK